MNVLFDTSVLVAALVEAHPLHERAAPWLKRAKHGEFHTIVASHTLAELYAALTRFPKTPRISPAEAWRLVHENIEPLAEFVSLSPSDYLATARRMADLGLSGGIVYDALIASAAQKAGAEKLVTFNADHFRRVWPEGADVICAP